MKNSEQILKMKKFSFSLILGLVALVGCKKYEFDTKRTMQTKTARLVNEWSPYAYYENGVEKTTYARFDMSVTTGRLEQVIDLDFGTGSQYLFRTTWEFIRRGDAFQIRCQKNPYFEENAVFEILRLESDTLWIKTKKGNDELEYHFASR